jgi:hypothetical protein
MYVPCSQTPAGPRRSATTALRCVLRLIHGVDSCESYISRLNNTARTLAVYASQDGLLHRHARLAFGWLVCPFRVGLDSHWVQRKVFLLSQALGRLAVWIGSDTD